MLDRRNEQAVARFFAPGNLQRRCECQHVRFGRATGEENILRVGPDQVGNLFARFLHQTADGPTLRVHRRGVPGQP
jgi:hypothetical protein